MLTDQQMFDLDELNQQWYEYDEYWSEVQQTTPKVDKLIAEFNEKVGLV